MQIEDVTFSFADTSHQTIQSVDQRCQESLLFVCNITRSHKLRLTSVIKYHGREETHIHELDRE